MCWFQIWIQNKSFLDPTESRHVRRTDAWDHIQSSNLSPLELGAWDSFVSVVQKCLGNERAEDYADLVNNMLTAHQKPGCRMSLKMLFLPSHLDVSASKFGRCKWGTRKEVPSRHFYYGNKRSRPLQRQHDGWVSLVSAAGRQNLKFLKHFWTVASHS